MNTIVSNGDKKMKATLARIGVIDKGMCTIKWISEGTRFTIDIKACDYTEALEEASAITGMKASDIKLPEIGE